MAIHMTDSQDEREIEPAEYLKRFLFALSADRRRCVSSILAKLRKHLRDAIPAKASSKSYLSLLHELSEAFALVPLHMRKDLKSHLLNGLIVSLPTSSISFSVFTICLCIMELNALRNVDRLDLESQDIVETVDGLNQKLLPKLSAHVLAQRTNIPNLFAWALSMLLFTFQACIEWICANHCDSAAFSSHNVLQFDHNALEHPSVPVVMKVILCLQRKRRPFPEPPKPYSLFDLLFSCAVSGSHALLEISRPVPSITPSVCPMEASEPPASKPTSHALSNHSNVKLYPPDVCDIRELTPEIVRERLERGTAEEALSCLQSLLHAMLQLTGDNSCLTHCLVAALKCTTGLLTRLHSESSSGDSSYENGYYLIVQLWTIAAEQRILLSDLPQSYLLLAAFMCPYYESMSQPGFVRAVISLARFLTVYQSLFRCSILPSPHWYLQLITDVVVSVIDRLEKAQNHQPDKLEEAMCACIIAISRPFAALHTDEPDVRAEFSRVLKMPLESIVSRMASCRSIRGVGNKTPVSDETDRPVLGQRIRELLYHYLLLPMIRVIDTWALSQARISIRPAAAKILLDQLVNQVVGEPDGSRVLSKLDTRKAPAAVGGLHIADRLAVKRRR